MLSSHATPNRRHQRVASEFESKTPRSMVSDLRRMLKEAQQTIHDKDQGITFLIEI